MKKAIFLRDQLNPDTLIHGNGDVYSMEEGLNKAEEFGVDGVMIGRGIFQNPWFFNKTVTDKTPEERLDLLWQHALLFTKTWKNDKNFAILKRFFKIYTSDFYGAATIRASLMETNELEDVRIVLNNCGYKVEC